MKYITITLTDEQVKELEPLQDRVDAAYFDSNKGAIMAQVMPCDGVMECCFVTNYEVKKMYSVLDKEPPE